MASPEENPSPRLLLGALRCAGPLRANIMTQEHDPSPRCAVILVYKGLGFSKR